MAKGSFRQKQLNINLNASFDSDSNKSEQASQCDFPDPMISAAISSRRLHA